MQVKFPDCKVLVELVVDSEGNPFASPRSLLRSLLTKQLKHIVLTMCRRRAAVHC